MKLPSWKAGLSYTPYKGSEHILRWVSETSTWLLSALPPRFSCLSFLFLSPSENNKKSLLSEIFVYLSSVVKNPPANARDSREVGSIPGLGRSSREGNGNPLKYSFFFFFFLLAASTAAGRTGRHGPSCGRSARGLCRWAGALPAAPFRLRGTILWRFGAAKRKPLTARVRRAAQ